MPETAIDRFWELVFGAIHLNPQVFLLIQTLPLGRRAALIILLIAGFSQAIGQATVLFINRVRPVRFVLSLVISSVLFVVSTGFWIGSTWLVSHFLFGSRTSLEMVFRTLGLAQAPLILSIFVALPYLGSPIYALLSLWTLLGLVVGLDVLVGLSPWQAFLCGSLGWVVFQSLQRTIGRPATLVGRWLTNTAAGIKLVTNVQDLEKLIETGSLGDRGER
jgi:hypothetical protein